jgi:hypothetical protein
VINRHRAGILLGVVYRKLLGHEHALEFHKRELHGVKLDGHILVATEQDDLVQKTLIVERI